MEWVKIAIQVIIAVSIFNVWFLNFSKSTPFRGGDAGNMEDEFKAYGLPSWFMKVIGFLKVSLAIALLAGIYYPELVMPAAAGMALLMSGAVSMHFKVKDPVKKAFPAFTFLVLSLILIFF